MVADGLGQHSLANTRWTVQQNTLPGFYLTFFEHIGAYGWENKRHVYDFLGVLVPCDVCKTNVRFGVQNAMFQCIFYFSVVLGCQLCVHIETDLERALGFVLKRCGVEDVLLKEEGRSTFLACNRLPVVSLAARFARQSTFLARATG